MLLVNHRNLTKGDFWAPPGGGVEFGQNAHQALIREFKEETFLNVRPGALLFSCEFIQPPLHAIELFFEAISDLGKPGRGLDPESTADQQIITDVAFLSFDEIMRIPVDQRHGIFRFVTSADELRNLTGFYTL